MTELGVFGSATYATTLSGIDEMMNVLPNNDANEISARDVRNVVLTLYDDIQGASSSEFFYTDTPSTVTVGGINSGQVFASMSLFTIFNKMFHKDYPPTSGLKFVGLGTTTLDFKGVGSASYSDALQAAGVPNPTVAANSGFDELVSFELEWTATKATYDFDPGGSIERSPVPTLPEKNGNPLFDIGVPAGGGSDSVGPTKPKINVSNTYTFKCKDIKGSNTQASISLSYGLRYYLGVVSTRSTPSSQQIRDLALGANNGGQSLSGTFQTTFVRSYSNHGGGGKYLIWCFPSTWGTPKFYQFGTQLWTGPQFVSTVSYVNEYGYTTPYNVWITVDTYASSVASYEIKLT